MTARDWSLVVLILLPLVLGLLAEWRRGRRT